VRASLQHALDNYKTGHITLSTKAELSKSDTRSFGESHASELSNIPSDHNNSEPGIPLTPPQANFPLPSSHPIDPRTLNQSPAQLPSYGPATSTPTVPDDTATLPTLPTVAETGVPVIAGTQGPGPATGSLHDIRGASAAGPGSNRLPDDSGRPGPGFARVGTTKNSGAAKYESAEEEKKRLQREDRDRLLTSQQTAPVPAPGHETAEEEKKRLEREERERVLSGGGNQGNEESPKDGDEDLPPYPNF
jgi:hypothetical protein